MVFLNVLDADRGHSFRYLRDNDPLAGGDQVAIQAPGDVQRVITFGDGARERRHLPFVDDLFAEVERLYLRRDWIKQKANSATKQTKTKVPFTAK